MSSRRSLSGGTRIGITLRRKYRSSRKLPFSISSSRSLLVAAITRTSTLIVRAEPSRSTSPSCSTRSTLACVFGAHVADFVEEDRAAVRLLELADLFLGRAGERALLVAEELRLDQLLGDGRAVDLHEALAAAQAVAMDGARDELLADPLSPSDAARWRWSAPRARSRPTPVAAPGFADHLVPHFDRALQRRFSSRSRVRSSALRIVTSTRSLASGFSMKSNAPAWSPPPPCSRSRGPRSSRPARLVRLP